MRCCGVAKHGSGCLPDKTSPPRSGAGPPSLPLHPVPHGLRHPTGPRDAGAVPKPAPLSTTGPHQPAPMLRESMGLQFCSATCVPCAYACTCVCTTGVCMCADMCTCLCMGACTCAVCVHSWVWLYVHVCSLHARMGMIVHTCAVCVHTRAVCVHARP